MKVLSAILLCFLVLKTSSEEIENEAEHDREKRVNLPDIDVSNLPFLHLTDNLMLFKAWGGSTFRRFRPPDGEPINQ